MLDALLMSIKNQISCKNIELTRRYTLLANELFKKHEFGTVKYCNTLIVIAQAEMFLEDYPKVLVTLGRINQVLDKTDFVEDKQAFLEISAKYFISQKQFNQARDSVNGLIETATEHQDKKCLFEAFCLMSDTMAINLNFDEAIFWLQKALALAKNMSNIVLERKAIDLIVQMQFKSGNIAMAIDALKHTINIEKNSKGIERQALAYSKICNVLLYHSKISELRTVLASFADFLDENDSLKHKIEYQLATIHLAIIDTRLEDAFEYVRKLEDLALTTDNPPILLKAMQLKGEIFYHLGDHVRAESMLKLATELYETQEKGLIIKEHVATCYLLSKNYILQGKLEQARECFLQARKLEKELMMAGIPFNHTLTGIAKLYIMQSMYCAKETVKGYAFSQSYFNKSKWVSAYEFAKSLLDKKTQNDYCTDISLVELVLITGRIIHDRFLLSSVKDHEAIVYSKFAKEKVDEALNFLVSNGITLHKSELAQLRDDILRLKAGRVGS
jgi:tetratricopeptide (TPR) repeat protein